MTEKINPCVKNIKDIDSSWNIDGINDIETVQYDGEEKILTYQYVWGEGGHTDSLGTLISALSFQKEQYAFTSLDSWLENRETDDIDP